jgi:hypothetical protein
LELVLPIGRIIRASQGFQRLDACGADFMKRAKRPGKVFWFFFSKKNFFLIFKHLAERYTSKIA